MVVLLTVLALATGCGVKGLGLGSAEPSAVAAQPDLSGVQGDRTVIVQSSDIGARPVLVHHPDSVGAHAPLVVVFHGEGGSAAQARDGYGWNAVADREGFVVAYPDGANHAWNAGPTCCFPHDAGVNDIGYLNQTLSALAKQDLIDRSRVYAVGFSAGGSMAYTWECAHPGVLAGVGPVDANLLIGCPVVAPVSVAAVYGGTDKVVAPADVTAPVSAAAAPSADPPSTDGDQATDPSAPAPGTSPQAHMLSAPGARAPGAPAAGDPLTVFRGIDMCPAQPSSAIGGPPAVERSWNCASTHSVSAAVVQGVGHQWPGAPATAGRSALPGAAQGTAGSDSSSTSGADPSSSSFDTDEWLWDHLRDARSR